MSEGAERGPALSGQVVDRDGAPVAGAAVMFAGASPEHPDIAQMTDAEGRFRYPRLAPGRYTIVARDAQGRNGRAEAEVTAGAAAQARIVLGEGP